MIYKRLFKFIDKYPLQPFLASTPLRQAQGRLLPLKYYCMCLIIYYLVLVYNV